MIQEVHNAGVVKGLIDHFMTPFIGARTDGEKYRFGLFAGDYKGVSSPLIPIDWALSQSH